MTTSNPKEAHVATQAIQAGINPMVLSMAKQYLGSKDFIGLCEKFVEQATNGKSGLYPSAIAHWNAGQGKVQGLQGIQPGDAIFFGADQSNHGYGHTGVYAGNGKMLSATDVGVRISDLGNWVQQTGQKLLGYIPHPGRPVAQQQPTSQPNLADSVNQLAQRPMIPPPTQVSPMQTPQLATQQAPRQDPFAAQNQANQQQPDHTQGGNPLLGT